MLIKVGLNDRRVKKNVTRKMYTPPPPPTVYLYVISNIHISHYPTYKLDVYEHYFAFSFMHRFIEIRKIYATPCPNLHSTNKPTDEVLKAAQLTRLEIYVVGLSSAKV